MIGNTTAGRGVNYDGVNLEDGSLSIASGADFNISLNGSGSTVNFGDAFWATDKAWIVFDLDSDTDTITSGVTGMFNLGTISLDSLGQNYASYGSFGLSTASGDMVLKLDRVSRALDLHPPRGWPGRPGLPPPSEVNRVSGVLVLGPPSRSL